MSLSKYYKHEFVSMTKDASIQDAAHMMRRHHRGEVILVKQHQGIDVPIGIITDRDLVIEVLAMDVDIEKITIGSILSTELVTVVEDQNIYEVLDTMQQYGVFRVPVVDKTNKLVGLIDTDIIIKVLTEQMTMVLALIQTQRQVEKNNRP